MPIPRILAISAALLAGGAAVLAWSAAAQDEGASQAAPLPAVTVSEASTRALAETARFSGRLDADSFVEIEARVSGLLLEVAFQAGQIVEAGDLLFRIEPDLYQAAMRQAEGALRSAEAQRDLAEIERDRQAELVRRDAAPQANLDNAEAALGRAEGDLIQAEAALQSAQLNLSYTEITAPFPGRIGPNKVDVGTLIDGSTGSLATLIDLDPIHAEFEVPTALMRNFQEAVAAGTTSGANSVVLELANGSIYDLPGDVDFVDSEINAGTDGVTLRARFDNPDGLLLDKELVRVELRASEPQEALSVPLAAVQRDVQGAFVLVVDASDTVEVRRVVAGRTTEGFTVVTQGLEAGETVIVDGANKVRPGQQVDAVPAGDG